jgi:CheY-like chemotaxis protein
MKLLIVEDHGPTREVLTRLLSRAGHHVTTARCLAEARAAASGQPFDAVVSDLGLPDGTGIELMAHLRTAHNLRGIALSGYGMDDDVRRSREAGFVAHLVKPVDVHQLHHALRVLNQSANEVD